MTNEVQQCDRECAISALKQNTLLTLPYDEFLSGKYDFNPGVQAARIARIRMERDVVQPLRDQLAQATSFQPRVNDWMMECFGPIISGDKEERNHRFLEESIELVQSLGCSASEAHQLVDYVFNRPVGEPNQECGGVMVTLAALCLANDLQMMDAGETELARVWTKVEQIRAKQATKPKNSPLPELAQALAGGRDD